MAALRTYDPKKAELRWQRAWAQARLFEASARRGRPKWYSNVPYPYPDGFIHLGQGIAFLRAEFQSRYRRMAGYNVLHPQGFHCTGLPVVGAARRVAERDPKQIEVLRQMGVPDREIPRFADPLHWIDVFPRATMEDLQHLGAAIDWRRSFITTDLNPPYDAFVKWQFRRLREAGYVRLGKHPVIWCPRDQAPIGDHDRLEGEGETPAEFTLLKFPLGEKILVAATIRPETVFGQTNLWVDARVRYVEARVGTEVWILNEAAVEKLREQGYEIHVVGRVPGEDLIGKEVVAPAINKAIPILPSTFIDQTRGTGIVTSVPSDAPDDHVALRDLQGDGATLARYGLDPERVRAIQPVPIIRTEGFGPLPGVEIVERMGIRSQEDRAALEKAKEEVYRAGYYTGVMNANCGPFAGMRVEVAKEEVAKQLRANRQAAVLWEPSGDVICRCTARAIVKIVEDQWFLAYGDPDWKARAHEGLRKMSLYPEAARKQFEYTINWLNDWPCAHHRGLGTKLPWDDHWVIESLSDSTVYMAYYTIAHALQGGRLRSEVPWAKRLDDPFFGYVFRGKGDPAKIAKSIGAPTTVLRSLRKEFTYWYPFDLRHTGKGLVQNHMTFCLFNHTALFPEGQWPRGFGIIGHLAMGGSKMSKSRGNVWLLRDAIKTYGADLVRVGLANAGDGLEDPSFDTNFVESMAGRIQDWYRFATSRHRTRTKEVPIDAWFSSVMNRAITETRTAMEMMTYKAALRHGYFDLQSAWSWYIRRSNGVPHATILRKFIDVQTKILAPFVPHFAEEVWSRIRGRGFISAAPYPQAKKTEVSERAEAAERNLQAVMTDVREILKVTQLRPKRIFLYAAPAWKRRAYATLASMASTGSLDVGAAMKVLFAEAKLRERGRDVQDFVKKAVPELTRLSPEDTKIRSAPFDEGPYLASAAAFLGTEFRSTVTVLDAEAKDMYDPRGRARTAMPWRPAIFVE